jgi:hypothetical protein
MADAVAVSTMPQIVGRVSRFSELRPGSAAGEVRLKPPNDYSFEIFKTPRAYALLSRAAAAREAAGSIPVRG